MPSVWAEADLSGILVENRSQTPDRFELRVLCSNRPSAVRKTLASVMAALSDMGLSEDERGNVELVLAEVLNNVAEHAYEEDIEGLIELTARREDDHLRFTVTDEGRPMPGGCMPATPAPNPDPLDCDLPEGGFGWFLIRTLARNLSYERRGDSNLLRFEIRFDRPLRGS